jgi:hypothetical protein
MLGRTAGVVAEHGRSFGRGETVYDPGIMSRCSPASPVPCATALLFNKWMLPARRSARGAGSPVYPFTLAHVPVQLSPVEDNPYVGEAAKKVLTPRA